MLLACCLPAGVAHIVVFSLGFLALDLTGVEHFELPDHNQLHDLSIGATLVRGFIEYVLRCKRYMDQFSL